MKDKLNKQYLMDHLDTVKKVAMAVFVVVLLAGVVFLPAGKKDQDVVVAATETKATEEETKAEQKITVDVAGAVATPNVVTLESGSRIEDAIKACGGLTEDADLSQINRAAFLTDGEKIYIPKQGEQVPATAAPTTGQATDKVNLNTASAEQLQTLNGVGPATAQKIMTYRATYGGFKSPEELLTIDGIGDKTYNNIKDQVTV